MHTKEQAKQLWCPMNRYAGMQTIYGMDSVVVTNEESRCCASACAMWRWISAPLLSTWTSLRDERIGKAHDRALTPPVIDKFKKPKGTGWVPVGVPEIDEEGNSLWIQHWKRNEEDAREGYCGLAGRPEIVLGRASVVTEEAPNVP